MGRSVSSPEERSSSSQESTTGFGFFLGIEEAFLSFCGDNDNILIELSNSMDCQIQICFTTNSAYLSVPWTFISLYMGKMS